jgi:hypothetical protein
MPEKLSKMNLSSPWRAPGVIVSLATKSALKGDGRPISDEDQDAAAAEELPQPFVGNEGE